MKSETAEDTFTEEFWTTYSIDVLWGGCVSSIGPVALKSEVVFGPKKD